MTLYPPDLFQPFLGQSVTVNFPHGPLVLDLAEVAVHSHLAYRLWRDQPLRTPFSVYFEGPFDGPGDGVCTFHLSDGTVLEGLMLVRIVPPRTPGRALYQLTFS